MRSQLADLFYKNAAEMPDKQAIWCDGKTATYQEMANRTTLLRKVFSMVTMWPSP